MIRYYIIYTIHSRLRLLLSSGCGEVCVFQWGQWHDVEPSVSLLGFAQARPQPNVTSKPGPETNIKPTSNQHLTQPREPNHPPPDL